MRFFTKREQIVILILVIIVVSITFLNLYKKNSQFDIMTNSKDEKLEEVEEIGEIDTDESKDNEEIIMIHISGQVYKPGLVQLKNGSRVIDAVNLAGGLKSEADLDRINLAKKLVDEEKIYIPKIGEENDATNNGDLLSSSNSTTDKVNINTCTKEQLMSLPGIGEVLATRIIEYRETNKFQNIEDIMNVSGIGSKKFDGIKDLITTN